MWAYYPFVFLLIPVVQALAGGSDGNLGYVLFCAPVVGALAYSVLLGLAAVFIKVFHCVTPKKNM